MKDYARNNFRQFAQNNNLKNKPKKQGAKSSKKLLLYIVAIIIGIIIIFSIISIFSSNNSEPKEKVVNNKADTPELKTPEIFTTPESTPAPIDTSLETPNESLETVSVISETINEDKQTNKLNSASMQEIANENLAKDEVTTTTTEADEVIEIDNSPKFTFYNDLSNQSVESDVSAKAAKKYAYTYMLQVGSYKDKEAVDAMRARLLLIGLKPDVSKHGSWYRIDVGPVHSKREGDILKHKLEAARISGSMLRQISKIEVIEEPEPNTSENKAN